MLDFQKTGYQVVNREVIEMISVVAWILWTIVGLNALLFLIPSRARNRSMDSLKIFRYEVFENYWKQLPDYLQTDDVGKELATVVNHATGARGEAENGRGDSGGRREFRLKALIWLVGVILTATLPISKFHIVWIYLFPLLYLIDLKK